MNSSNILLYNAILSKILTYAKSDVFYIKQGLSFDWKNYLQYYIECDKKLYNLITVYQGKEGIKEFVDFFIRHHYRPISDLYYKTIRDEAYKKRITPINTSEYYK